MLHLFLDRWKMLVFLSVSKSSSVSATKSIFLPPRVVGTILKRKESVRKTTIHRRGGTARVVLGCGRWRGGPVTLVSVCGPREPGRWSSREGDRCVPLFV